MIIMARHEQHMRPSPFDLDDAESYLRWRDAKLACRPATLDELIVEIADPAAPTSAESARIIANCRRANMAIYACGRAESDPDRVRRGIRALAEAMSLRALEDHRSAGDDGIVALEVADDGTRGGYIPYTDRPLNWHTDGYYNAPDARIGAFVLHCVRSALEGGENGLLDPEIAYIRLRDAHPEGIEALMHPAAMTIPANIEPDGRERPASVGPVFLVDPMTGALQMRYTARSRNIVWRDDPATAIATGFLTRLLTADGAPVFRHRLAPGEGLICNNVLHSRTGFRNERGAARGRLHFRARFLNRIADS